jgi:uncharacterized protein (TIGR00290 family)
MCWSSGKDSAYAVHVLRSRAEYQLAGLLTTVTKDFDRVSMHGVRRELLERQAKALELPLVVVEIPSPCSNEVYEAEMAKAIDSALDAGVSAMAFGDLFLEDVRAYRERMLARVKLKPVFPLWGRPTHLLAREMIKEGVDATLTCVDPRVLPASFAGRRFDEALLKDLPSGADPCAERGEFHTFCSGGPMFRAPIPIQVGDTLERDGFIFADVLPA